MIDFSRAKEIQDVANILTGQDRDTLMKWCEDHFPGAPGSLDGTPNPDPECRNAGMVAWDRDTNVYLDFETQEIVFIGDNDDFSD